VVFITEHYGNPAAGSAMQSSWELNRALYMDERRYERDRDPSQLLSPPTSKSWLIGWQEFRS